MGLLLLLDWKLRSVVVVVLGVLVLVFSRNKLLLGWREKLELWK